MTETEKEKRSRKDFIAEAHRRTAALKDSGPLTPEPEEGSEKKDEALYKTEEEIIEKRETGNIMKRLQDLLVYPREELNEELKGWLDISKEEDRANLAQAILALANSGGGYVILGYEESGGTWAPAEPRPSSLNEYTQDLINDIVQRYADPPFHCEVHHILNPQNGATFPIVIVPGNHRVPIRAKRDGPDQKHVRQNAYYIRRPGPKSEPPQSAQEWDDLIKRCVITAREDLLENIRSLLFGISRIPSTPEEEYNKKLEEWIKESRTRWQSLLEEKLSQENPSRYSKGIWIVAYCVTGNLKSLSRKELFEVLKKVQGHETGWPPWWIPIRNHLAPYPYDDVIECWLKDSLHGDAAHSDFWRASPQGMMFLLRGYQEDCEYNNSGTIFSLTLPIWRVGECLLHAERLANEIGGPSSIVNFNVTWEGLAGRILSSWPSRRLLFLDERRAVQNSVTSKISIQADQISSRLPEIVENLVKPLYEIFDFYTVSLQLVREELAEMKAIK